MQSTSTSTIGFVKPLWAVAQGVAYKPFAVLVASLMVIYLDVVASGIWHTYTYAREAKAWVTEFDIKNRTLVYLEAMAPEVSRMRDMGLEWRTTMAYLVLVGFIICCLLEQLKDLVGRLQSRWEVERLNANLVMSAERMVPGSVLEDKVASPGFQVEVWTCNETDSTLYYRGVAFRVGKFMTTAHHVVADATRVVLKAPNSNELEVKSDRFVETGCDVTWIVLSDQDIGKLGIAAGKFAVVAPKGVWVKIAAMTKGTFGILNEHSAMGMVEYAGSTTRGFSGAPYHIGKIIYGMHVGADPKNVGFASSYIAMLHRQSMKPVLFPEDSVDYLIGQMDLHHQEEFIYERSPFDASEYRVRVGGVYHAVDSDTFCRLSDRYHSRRYDDRRYYDDEAARSDVSFLGQRHPEEREQIPMPPADLLRRAQDLPPAPRGAAMFTPESAVCPIVAASQPQQGGPSQVPQSALSQNDRELLSQVLESLTQTQNSATYSPESTRAPPNAPLTTTTAGSGTQRQGTQSPRQQGTSYQAAQRQRHRRNQRTRVTELRRQLEEAQRQLASVSRSMVQPESVQRGRSGRELPPSYENSCLGAAILPEHPTTTLGLRSNSLSR
uniref:Serine protease n=1 Tax=Crocidura tanakae ribovirus 2 TaxID=3139557 RepID=A0AB38ZK83_9VIRU